MNNIILFTVRSGSTTFADILSYSTNTLNLGESHSCVRDYNYNTDAHKETDLYNLFRNTNVVNRFYNEHTRSGDYIGLFKSRERRTDLLKTVNINWTIKENTDKITMDTNFVDYWAKAGANIYMTYRKDLVKQFISFINARYRTEVLNLPNNAQFIFTNTDQGYRYEDMKIRYSWLLNYVNVFLAQVMMWRITYEKHKDIVKLVCYEDHVKPMNFESFGIKKEVVQQYQNEPKHLVPTPFNTDRAVVVDDHPEPIINAWNQSLYLVQKHKYLVEV